VLARTTWYALGGDDETVMVPEPAQMATAPEPVRMAAAPPPPPVVRRPAASIVTRQAAPVVARVAPVGAWRLQIISLSSRKAVRREWARLNTANPDLLRGLTLTVSPNRSGSMFRMRVGPLAGRDAANKLCAGLKRRRTGCLILRPKP